ncbi:MAG: hypothetical protein LBM72_02295, partial [Mycoplasmataceae bacterium]|nr:hypothetical protein [Mycoplasmataceae bacterium]
MHNKKMYPKRKHNKKSVPFILAWAGLVIGILVIAYGITINLDDFGANTLVYNGIGNKLWFGYLQQFTKIGRASCRERVSR